jgi:TolB-like protein/uncharacterized protein HemY
MPEHGDSEIDHGPTGKSAATTPRVFISYSSQDLGRAEKVCEALEAADLPCWMAPRDVKAGAQYADAIVRAINEARAVVLVLSASAVSSSHVAREVERAASKHKPIIPFRLDAAALSPELEYFLSNSQWVDVPKLGIPAALDKLKEALSHVSGSSSTVPTSSHRGSRKRTAKQLITVAAVVFAVVAAIALGFQFWSSSHRTGQIAAVAPITDKSIAVLPLTDMSEMKDQEYFADGMAEEVLDLLAKIPSIKVIARTSSFQFKGTSTDLRLVGSSLGAAYVVEGTVRKSGDQLRVTAQLIGTRDGSHVWSETYDERFGEVLTIQDRIAASIVRALQVTIGADDLPSRPMLKSPEAYDLYLRGRHAMDRFDKAGFESAAGYFQQALELDPSSIRAAEWLAVAHEFLAEWGFVPVRAGYERARVSVERALKLDPNSGLAHSILCTIEAVYDWNAPAALEECRRALALEPRNAQVLLYAGQMEDTVGHWDEAKHLLNAGVALDPLFAGFHVLLAIASDQTGHLAEAEARRRLTLKISPSFERGHYELGTTLLAEGKIEAALEEMRQETEDGGRDAGIAMVYHAMGRKVESDAALTRLTKERAADMASWIAEVYAYRGERDKAFEWLNRAYQQKDVNLWLFKTSLAFNNLESDPRYKVFLKKMNLPE